MTELILIDDDVSPESVLAIIETDLREHRPQNLALRLGISLPAMRTILDSLVLEGKIRQGASSKHGVYFSLSLYTPMSETDLQERASRMPVNARPMTPQSIRKAGGVWTMADAVRR